VNRLILLTGATRSGKSRLAVELARQFGPRILYLATCRPADDEMARRVARHRQARPPSWQTLEVAENLPDAISRVDGTLDGVLLDCLTLYVARLVSRKASDEVILKQIRTLCETLRRAPLPMVVVTNEVGWGVVPTSRSGRRFRDLAGLANQLVAQAADEVYLVIAGLPLCLKRHPSTPGPATLKPSFVLRTSERLLRSFSEGELRRGLSEALLRRSEASASQRRAQRAKEEVAHATHRRALRPH